MSFSEGIPQNKVVFTLIYLLISLLESHQCQMQGQNRRKIKTANHPTQKWVLVLALACHHLASLLNISIDCSQEIIYLQLLHCQFLMKISITATDSSVSDPPTPPNSPTTSDEVTVNAQVELVSSCQEAIQIQQKRAN